VEFSQDSTYQKLKFVHFDQVIKRDRVSFLDHGVFDLCHWIILLHCDYRVLDVSDINTY